MKKINVEKEKILELKEKRLSVAEICKELNVTYGVLYKRCKEFGIKLQQSYRLDSIDKNQFLDLYNSGYNDCQIGKILGVRHQRIQEYRTLLKLPHQQEHHYQFTENQLQIFLGGMLGDSYLGIEKDSKNAYFTFRHSLAQEQYCLWKYEQFKEFCQTPYYSSQYDGRTKKTYSGVTIKSRYDELFTSFEDKFYHKTENGRVKYINPEILKQLNPLGLAIWFMDDGFRIKSGLAIATNCFSAQDLLNIQSFFKSKFNIEIKIQKNKTITFPCKEAKKFCKLIFPYIHENCRYKIEKVVLKLRESGELLNEDNPNPSSTEM